MRVLSVLRPLAVLSVAACQPSAADRDSSPAAPAPTTAKAIERASPAAVSPEVSVHNVVYRCEDGRRVAARYDGERAFLSLGEQSVTLTASPSASGVRYVGAGTQWWTRGMSQARLATLAKDRTYAEADVGILCVSETSSPSPALKPTGG